jgi:hypothetical protein
MRSRVSIAVFVVLLAPILCAITGCASAVSNLSTTTSGSSTGGSGGGSTSSNATSSYWVAPSVGSTNSLGTVLYPTGSGTAMLKPTITSANGTLSCTATSWNSTATTLTITYKDASSNTVHVTVALAATTQGFAATIDADNAVVNAINMGDLSTTLGTTSIAVPYYTGNVYYATNLSKFVNAWWDWKATHATSLSSSTASYVAKTNGSYNLAHEVLEIAYSSNVDAVFPSPGNSASPYMATLAGRVVLDIWDEGFSTIQSGLNDLGDYGINHCAGIIHDWQNMGYDNGLPQHYTANSTLGGSSAILSAMAQGTSNGCLMALHENYADYYPNYPDYTDASVALSSSGTKKNAWYNSSTGIQSYAEKPTWMVKNAETQSPLIHANYQTTASYLDVHSAAALSTYGDQDASATNGGMLTAWTSGNQALWQYERTVHDGPVLGEGGNHWYYTGQLDGVEAQFGAGSVAVQQDVASPLFVDFDLFMLHPLQVNHGMGYYSRWTTAGVSTMTNTQLDAYRMQEIAYGHAPFLGNKTWNDVAKAFVEANLLGPVATAYGTATASAVSYHINDAWVSSSSAALAGNYTQVQASYANGLSVVANAATSNLSWNGLTIPQYGWAAKGSDLLAYTAQCGSTICDYARTSTTLFANARNQTDSQWAWGYAVPSVTAVTQGSGRSFKITYEWKVLRELGTAVSYKAFVHFVDDSKITSSNDGIVFQGDFYPTPSTTNWQTGNNITNGPLTVTLGSSVPDGTYSIRIGLYDAATGTRLVLGGNNDGNNRYIIGYVTVSNNGTSVSFTAPTTTTDARLNAAGSVVDFGDIQTDGMVSIRQENGNWVLRPFPRYRNFTVRIKDSAFAAPSVVTTAGSTTGTVIPQTSGSYWTLPLNGSKTYSWPIE